MDWTKIKENFPKAHTEAKKWWIGEADLSQFEPFELCEGVNVNFRYLYDFFDEQDIYVEVYPVNIDINFRAMDWSYDISNESIEVYGYKTRTEAETEAFEKAFQILEERL